MRRLMVRKARGPNPMLKRFPIVITNNIERLM
jgi:hypothetical protein